MVLFLALSFVSIPKTKQEAFSHLEWSQATFDVMVALDISDICDLVPLPLEKIKIKKITTIDCRWLYTVEFGLEGKMDQLKA